MTDVGDASLSSIIHTNDGSSFLVDLVPNNPSVGSDYEINMSPWAQEQRGELMKLLDSQKKQKKGRKK